MRYTRVYIYIQYTLTYDAAQTRKMYVCESECGYTFTMPRRNFPKKKKNVEIGVLQFGRRFIYGIKYGCGLFSVCRSRSKKKKEAKDDNNGNIRKKEIVSFSLLLSWFKIFMYV